jgi:hypothetical protein
MLLYKGKGAILSRYMKYGTMNILGYLVEDLLMKRDCKNSLQMWVSD